MAPSHSTTTPATALPTRRAHATISFTWNDTRGELTIGAQQGSYAKAPTSREFRIVFVGEQHGTGIGESATVDRTLTYTGAAVAVPTR